MSSVDPLKYIVIKREDVEEDLFYARLADIEIDDAVVIRKQDVFAEAGLRAYAGGIMTAVEVIGAVGAVVVDPGVLDHMVDLAEFFNDEANEAHSHAHKIPD